jgi:AbrB family looped-hinge helix DNA binding protein
MRSKITDKFQITIPKSVRELLKLHRNDLLEWKIEEGGITVEAVSKPFLQHRARVHVGPGDIGQDILEARQEIARGVEFGNDNSSE